MARLPQNQIKIKKLEDFLKLSAKEIRNLPDKELTKGLRYFRTDLRYDLRKPLANRSKGKIRDIREIYISTISVPNPTLFTPSKKHRKAAQEFIGVGDKWKKIIINKEPGEEIYFKEGNLRIKSKYVDKGRGKFIAENLIENPEKEIARVLKGEKFDVSKLICGDAYIGGHATPRDYGDNNSKIVKDALLEDVNYLMNVYGADSVGEDANNYWEDWLFGVELINLRNQKKKSKRKFKSKIGKNINRNKRKLSNGKKTGSSRRL